MEHKSKPARARSVIAYGACVMAILVVALVMTRRHAPPAEVQSTAPPDATVGEAAPREELIAPTVNVESETPSPATSRSASAADAATDERRFMFECDNVVFAVRTIPGEATLFAPQLLGNDSIVLHQTEADSGARYVAADAVFWNKGNVATFEIRRQVFVDCTENGSRGQQAHAQAIGDVLWASGNEPPWTLDIHPQQLTLTMERGARHVEFPYRDRVEVGDRTTYRSTVGTQEILAVVDRRACNDSKSGEAFPATLSVTFEQRTYYGCAALFPLNMPRPQ